MDSSYSHVFFYMDWDEFRFLFLFIADIAGIEHCRGSLALCQLDYPLSIAYKGVIHAHSAA
jgi:hypothetical protein